MKEEKKVMYYINEKGQLISKISSYGGTWIEHVSGVTHNLELINTGIWKRK